MATVGNRPFFTPNQISGCQLWLDAADPAGNGSQPANGAGISTWKDKSSNGFSGTAVNSPTFQRDVLNGLPVIRFNGTNQYINFGNVLNLGTNGLSLFFLTKCTSNSGQVGMVGKTSFRGLQGRWGIYYDTVSSGPNGVGVNNFVDDTNQALAGIVVNPNLQYNIFTGVNNRTSTNILYRNGSFGMQQTFSATPTNLSIGDSLFVGTYGDGTGTSPQAGFYLNGDIAEVIVYFSALSTAQRQQVEGYLAWKWGLQWALPTTHPYKSSPIAPLLNPLPYTDWTPLQISNCSLWLDAADTSTVLTNANGVYQWTDKSGANKNAVQTTTGRYPSYTQKINGNRVITMSSSGTSMYVSNFTMNIPPTVLVVFQRFGNGGAYPQMFIEHGADVNGNPGFYISSGNWDAFSVRTSTAWQQFRDTNLPTEGSGYTNAFNAVGSTFIYAGQLQPNLWRLNGSARTTTTTVNSGTVSGSLTTQLNIGSRNQASLFSDVYFCEILFFNGNIPLASIQQAEGYLAWKWGLQGNLPSDHPYKNSPVPLVLTAPTIAPRVLQNSSLFSFQPIQISGCQVWLDAADPNGNGTSLANGASVSTWVDKSGNGRNAVGNLGTGTYSTTGFNSRPTVQITASGNMASPIPAGSFSSGIVVFVIFQKTGANNSVDTIVTRTAPNSIPSPFDIYTGFLVANRTYRLVGNGTDYRQATEDTSVVSRRTSPTIWSVAIFSTSPSNWSETVDGTSTSYSITQSTVGTGNYGDNATFLYIGTRGDNFTKMTGNISEIIAYNASSFSTAQRQQVEGYLAWKWGLQANLPSTHPFKSAPPTMGSFPAPARSLGVLGQWQPTQFSGCQIWIDAADSSTVTLSGGTVASVVDKSANRLTLTGGSSFTYNTTRFQGRYPSFFNNSAASDAKIGSNASFNLSQPMTIFVTGVMNTGVEDNDMIFDGNINRISIYNRTANFFANPSQLSQGFPYLTSPYIVCGFANTTSSSLFLNSTTLLSGPIGNSALTSIVVGNRQNGNGSPYKGHLCEFIIYQGLLTTAQRQQVEGYLAWKWGLQANLPATHPFKLWPPPP